MLKTKPLDDRSYAQILESAMNRLPALCPSWTDYNAHDPGVTLIELFAWYEEMQRFHLDQMTEAVRRKLLALLGVEPAPAKAAACRIELSGTAGFWPEGTRLHTPEGIPFALSEGIQVGTTRLTEVQLFGEKRIVEMTELLHRGAAAIQPFLYGDEPTDMVLAFADVDTDRLRLWFEVEEPQKCARNPFAEDSEDPRVIRWLWNGLEIEPIKDETHALSVSGFVILPVTEGTKGELRLSLEDPGCEETVRIRAVQCHVCFAEQKETWARCFFDTVKASKRLTKDLSYAPAAHGTITAFIRTKSGWEQLMEGSSVDTDSGKHLVFDTHNAVQDGKDNLLMICTAENHIEDTFFSSNGLPGQEIPLPLGGRQPVGDLLLLCDSLDVDGKIRPLLWRRVDDLNVCGPRDRVFRYDSQRESLFFGDGRHGAIVPAGNGSILVASLSISLCSKGNVPEDTTLLYGEGVHSFHCTAGTGGAEPENAEEACIRFMKRFSDTRKCVTVDDYARLAKETPGLRVAMAKALPGFDPREPSGNTMRPLVNVVVVPYGTDLHPVPDERFLSAVKKQLEKYRPICTEVLVSPPRYLRLSVQLRVRGDKTLKAEAVEAALHSWFNTRKIGETVSKSELSLHLQKQPGLWKIERLELITGGGCVRNSMGDVVLPPDGIIAAEDLQIEIL